MSPRNTSPTVSGRRIVPNVVTSTLADYRGYDTLGETTVIFTAGIGVLLLLKGRRRRNQAGGERRKMGNGGMKLDLILRIGTKLLLPFILLFALYVQFHGEFGPGGGFQAGVITAGMVILYALIFGVKAAKRIAPQALVERMVPLGVLIFAGAGVAGLWRWAATTSTIRASPRTRRTATSSGFSRSSSACLSRSPAP